VNHDDLNPTPTRTWRDIPQPVVPRAMSREGRWRLAMAAMRVTAVVATIGVMGWGVWLVSASVRQSPGALPAAAKAAPVKAPELRTDGVLDNRWLARTLALPKSASLMELDLLKLQARLLAEDQVASATLTKVFPDRLVVQVSERSPVARLQVQWLGQRHTLLVARDGVVYAGEGYDPTVLETLPWLVVSPESLVPAGGHYRPIAGMELAAELLSKAGLEAEHLYNHWFAVSLLRLKTDRCIEVTTKEGSRILFSTTDDFFRQLAKLDTITDELVARAPGATATIDLTLGQNVPVTVNPAPAPNTTPAPSLSRAAPASRPTGLASAPVDALPHFSWSQPVTAASEQALFVLPHSQSKQTKREL
jgi:cell division protein FtsQ